MQFLESYKKIVIFAVAILIIGGIIFFSLTKKTPQTIVRKISPQIATNSASPVYNNQLNNDIKLTFSSSKYQDILSLTNVAAFEKDPVKQYQYYKLAFDKIAKAYQNTKDKNFKLVMIELKSYLRVLPGYNSNELIIPK